MPSSILHLVLTEDEKIVNEAIKDRNKSFFSGYLFFLRWADKSKFVKIKNKFNSSKLYE